MHDTSAESAALLVHFERRLRGPDNGDYIGPLLEITETLAPLHTEGALLLGEDFLRRYAPTVADTARADIAAVPVLPAWSGGAELATILGFLSATTPRRVTRTIVALGTVDEETSTYLDAVRARVGLVFDCTQELLDSLLGLADRIKAFDLEYSWNFLFEALPTAYARGGRAFISRVLTEAVRFAGPGTPPIGRFRIWNVLALGAMRIGDAELADQHLDRAALSLHDPEVRDAERRHYLALVESNRARVLMETPRLVEALAAATRALTVADVTPDRMPAVWQHAERGCRIAERLGLDGMWFTFLLERKLLLPPLFEGDVHYAARKYFRLVIQLVRQLGAAGLRREAAELAVHALALLDSHVPTWSKERALIKGVC